MTNCAFPASVSLIEAINKNPLDSRQMLCAKYERGLKYLIQRICPAFMEECFSATIEEAMAAVQTERVLTEEALQSFICQTARQIAATFPSISIAEKDPLFNLQVILAMRRKLTVFSSDQREALRRYYVNKESPASICAALGLAIEEFGSIRRIARDALEFKFNELRQPVSSPTQSEAVGRRGVTSVMKTKWKMRATA